MSPAFLVYNVIAFIVLISAVFNIIHLKSRLSTFSGLLVKFAELIKFDPQRGTK